VVCKYLKTGMRVSQRGLRSLAATLLLERRARRAGFSWWKECSVFLLDQHTQTLTAPHARAPQRSDVRREQPTGRNRAVKKPTVRLYQRTPDARATHSARTSSPRKPHTQRHHHHTSHTTGGPRNTRLSAPAAVSAFATSTTPVRSRPRQQPIE
jgi:hypothetical protein